MPINPPQQSAADARPEASTASIDQQGGRNPEINGVNLKTPDAISRQKPNPGRVEAGVKLRAADKVARIPIKIQPTEVMPRKPRWIRAQSQGRPEVQHLKGLLRELDLVTVCEEATCPNLGECFAHGTATFMVLGDICTRRCPFCDVAHGRPLPPEVDEPERLAKAIGRLALRYVVITSVDRDDLRDGGASHFASCVEAVRRHSPTTRIEILVPDFRGRMETALAAFIENPPDVFNHNLETVPSLYRQVRPGADYAWSLDLLKRFRTQHPRIPTKSGLMLGLGETRTELIATLDDLREHDCTMLTLGQYLQPSRHHLPVTRFLPPEEFDEIGEIARSMGFEQVASGPMVRSSYHADLQAAGAQVR